MLGTGDLSELALGWATYGVGDHMSHYNVNGGVAKTLIRHLIRWVAMKERPDRRETARETLHAILDTEISPELVPAKDGVIQSTEGTVGPYALNDFFLFYISRFGMTPSKVAYPGASGLEAMQRRRALAGEYAGRRKGRIRSGDDQGLAEEVPDPLLPDQPSSSARPCRTGPRSSPADRCRRAATGARRRTGPHGCGWMSLRRTYGTSESLLPLREKVGREAGRMRGRAGSRI